MPGMLIWHKTIEMNWYYASGGEKQGPVDQVAFDRLAAEGVILQSTLVWHEGLAEWQRYADAEPAMFCTECGKPFSRASCCRMGSRGSAQIANRFLRKRFAKARSMRQLCHTRAFGSASARFVLMG